MIGTAAGSQQAFVERLGANQVIDYGTTAFQDIVSEVDVVLDTVGGLTEERSWRVLKRGGILVSIVSGESGKAVPPPGLDVRGKFFIVQPDRRQLIKLGELLDDGHVIPVIERVLPLSRIQEAFAMASQKGKKGKVVLTT